MKKKISIVIPTYKRKKHLLNLLDSFKNKTTKDAEIIVVEQVENNEREYKKKADSLGLNLEYTFLADADTPLAKNRGVNKARGEYVIFFDDDVLLKTKLDFYIEDFKDKRVVAITGRSIAKGQKVEKDRTDTGRVSLFGSFSDGYSSSIMQEIDTVIGCNACWKKNIFLELGGFDEQFTGNAMREESDLSLRAKEKGYKILFDPRVEVDHVRAETGGARKTEGRLQWYYDFFSNETYFFLKHRPSVMVPFIMLTRIEWALRCMLGFGREVSFRSMVTPLLGFLDGYKKYRRFKNENRG